MWELHTLGGLCTLDINNRSIYNRSAKHLSYTHIKAKVVKNGIMIQSPPPLLFSTGHQCIAQGIFLSYHGKKEFNESVKFCEGLHSRLLIFGALDHTCIFKLQQGDGERMWVDVPRSGHAITIQSGGAPQLKSRGELYTTVCESGK